MWTLRYYLSKFRVLPLTIASLCLLFSAKMYDIVETGNALSQVILGKPAYAEEKKTEAEAEKDPKEASSEEEKPSETQDEKTKESPKEEEDVASAKMKTDEDAPVDPLANKNCTFSDVEVDVLQSLSKRREELDTLEKEIRLKENLLGASEVKLEEKITQIKGLEKTVRDLLKEYDTQEDAKIASLVKMYENMKPKDAARIFDEMEMPVLLLLVDKMSERRAAPILAKMSPTKAKELTMDLANDRRLRTDKEQELNALAPPSAAVPVPAQ